MTKSLVSTPIIPGAMWRVRAWAYLTLLILDAYYTAFGLGTGNHAQVQIGAAIGLIGVFLAAVNTPHELPNTASSLVPWFTTERCFWIYRGIALLGTVLAGFGVGQDAQWSSFTTSLATIFGLTVTTLRTSLVKAVNAPEVA